MNKIRVFLIPILTFLLAYWAFKRITGSSHDYITGFVLFVCFSLNIIAAIVHKKQKGKAGDEMTNTSIVILLFYIGIPVLFNTFN